MLHLSTIKDETYAVIKEISTIRDVSFCGSSVFLLFRKKAVSHL